MQEIQVMPRHPTTIEIELYLAETCECTDVIIMRSCGTIRIKLCKELVAIKSLLLT
jgi:hypothetical protein